MEQFGWLSADAIPAEFDLREHGWRLEPVETPSDDPVFPVLLSDLSFALALRSRRARAGIALVGVAEPIERAHMLALGFGEVLAPSTSLAELAERLRRLTRALAAVPRRRQHGRLQLDLLVREGYVSDRRLGLHPREFALLWRLAETPGEPVSADGLLSEIWQLNFKPQTNSLAVHVCRLRAKLAVAGLAQIIRTAPSGSYVLAAGAVVTEPAGCAATALSGDVSGLDEHVRIVAPLVAAD